MKLSAFSFILASVGLVSQVAANPIRLEIAVPASEATPFRLGHAAAHINGNVAIAYPPPAYMNITGPHVQMPSSKHVGCPMRAKAKAIQISNWFRQQIGLPLIEMPHGHRHRHPHHPAGMHPEDIDISPFIPIPIDSSVHIDRVVITHDGPVRSYPIHPPHHMRSRSFLGRVHKALMVLGPWEGRVVAFVLGCGIGSLLRMIWVLVIIAFRSVRSRDGSTAQLELLYDEEDEQLVKPPKYVEEQVVVEDKKVAA